jgi:hypothetical protein
MKQTTSTFYNERGLRGQRASPAGMDSPCLNTSLSKFLSVMLMTLFPSSIEGLMGLWEEKPLSSFSFKGLELGNESPPFKWEWFSEPLNCSPNEKCKPESMVGTMSPLEGNPRPFQGEEEVS